MQNEPFWKAKGVLLKNQGKTKEKKVTNCFFLKLYFYIFATDNIHMKHTLLRPDNKPSFIIKVQTFRETNNLYIKP